jgi:chemotaxis protein CheZ
MPGGAMHTTDAPDGAVAAAAAPQVFQQLGVITRQLHDALDQLGVMPQLQQSADGLPDARSRLSYIARKSGEAADKVLTAVDLAKQDRAEIDLAARRIMALGAGAAPGGPQALAGEVSAAAARIDSHLTDIMLAQDFHDLTGQVVAKVVALAIDLESTLLKLLRQTAPAQTALPAAPQGLQGPVIDATGRNDVVSGQDEVDDLLAQLGF